METITEKKQFISNEISKIYDQLVVNCRKVCGTAYDRYGVDLLPFSIEIFLDKPLEVQLKVIADKKLENYITHVMNFQLKLGTTGFYHRYRKHHEKQREYLIDYIYSPDHIALNEAFEDENPALDCLKKAIEKLDPYSKMIVDEIIVKDNSFLDVSKKYKITYTHLSRDLKKIKKELKRLCQHSL